LYSLPTEQIGPGEVSDKERRVFPEKTRNSSFWIRQGMVMKTQEHIQQRISFLQEQIESLEHFLPDTYQFLMTEMDHQQKELMALKIQDFYENLRND
jgi:hypothetical protein